jgi:cysteine desulfurase
MQPEIYLDNNATTFLSLGVRAKLIDAINSSFGNASSEHQSGEWARKEISEARSQIAGLLNAQPSQIYFGSGVTELTHWVLSDVFSGKSNAHLITTEVEHSCVLETASFLASKGVEVTRLAVNSEGQIDLPALKQAISDSTALVAIQWVNNETGVVQPIESIASICEEESVPFFCDAAQAVGKLPISFPESKITYLTASAHKMHGPSGIAALCVQGGVKISPLFFGGGQENNLRPGTENTLGIVGFGQAAAERSTDLANTIDFIKELRDTFEQQVISLLPDTQINGDTKSRVCNTTNLRFPGLNGSAIVALLDKAGIRCSQSSACTSNVPESSYVLRAMGLTEEEAYESIRFSFSDQNTADEITTVLSELNRISKRLSGFNKRKMNANSA